MHERRWTATWRDQNGKQQAYTFEVPDQYKPLPVILALAKGPLVARFLPSLKELEQQA